MPEFTYLIVPNPFGSKDSLLAERAVFRAMPRGHFSVALPAGATP
jgi:hypothetical protein